MVRRPVGIAGPVGNPQQSGHDEFANEELKLLNFFNFTVIQVNLFSELSTELPAYLGGHG